jgi:hypothetical protein
MPYHTIRNSGEARAQPLWRVPPLAGPTACPPAGRLASIGTETRHASGKCPTTSSLQADVGEAASSAKLATATVPGRPRASASRLRIAPRAGRVAARAQRCPGKQQRGNEPSAPRARSALRPQTRPHTIDAALSAVPFRDQAAASASTGFRIPRTISPLNDLLRRCRQLFKGPAHWTGNT